MEAVAAAAGEADVIARSMWRAANWQQHLGGAVRATQCVAAGPFSFSSLSLPTTTHTANILPNGGHQGQTEFSVVRDI